MVVETTERFVDGKATFQELLDSGSGAEQASSDAYHIVYDAANAEALGSDDPDVADWVHGAHEYASSASAHAHAAETVAGRFPNPDETAESVRSALAHIASPLLLREDYNPNFKRREAVENKESAGQAALLRDIFGPLPFRPVTLDPSWLTPTVTALAQGIYQDRTFNDLPILADALEEADCTSHDLLPHLRGPGEHVRGCWALDLLLGKS
jgi:hypothetical protein